MLISRMFFATCEIALRPYLAFQPLSPASRKPASEFSMRNAKCFAKIGERHPKCHIVLAGPITASRGLEILARLPVWAAIKGEYEKGVVRVLRGERGLIEHDMLSVEEMNAAPHPWQDKLHMHRYWDANPGWYTAPPPQLQVWSSRGCPWHCIFCVWPAVMTGNDPEGTQPRKIRQYNPDYLAGYIEEMAGNHRFRSVYFDDDTFNFGDKHVLGVCGVMKKIGLPWAAMCRADTVKQDTWKQMKLAGCFGVKIGFESGVQRVVDDIVRKGLDIAKAKETVKFLQSIGIKVHGTFTLGLPGETDAERQATLDFIQATGFDSVQVSGTAVIEGTPLHELEQRGSLEKYKGAVIDEKYIRESDGQKKVERIKLEMFDRR